MNRKVQLQSLEDDGYNAALHGKPCEAPTSRELDRAAWEIGYRAGKKIHDTKFRISRKDLLNYPDGTWILTDSALTQILDTRVGNEPRPDGFFWWRRKQLMDQLGMES